MKKWIIILVVIAVIVLSIIKISPNSSKKSSSNTNNQETSEKITSNASTAREVALESIDASNKFDLIKYDSLFLVSMKLKMERKAKEKMVSLEEYLQNNGYSSWQDYCDEYSKNAREKIEKEYGQTNPEILSLEEENYSTSKLEKFKSEWVGSDAEKYYGFLAKDISEVSKFTAKIDYNAEKKKHIDNQEIIIVKYQNRWYVYK